MTRKFRFRGLCIAVVLERCYQMSRACATTHDSASRSEWYGHHWAGRRVLAIAGLGAWP